MALQSETPASPDDREKRERGSRFRLVREQLGYKTQTAFAQSLNVRPNTVSQWEGGERFPEPPTLDEICRLSGRSADWFMYGRELVSPVSADRNGSSGAEEAAHATDVDLVKRVVAAVIRRDKAHPALKWSPEQLSDFVGAVYHVVTRHPDRDPDKVAYDLMG